MQAQYTVLNEKHKFGLESSTLDSMQRYLERGSAVCHVQSAAKVLGQ